MGTCTARQGVAPPIGGWWKPSAVPPGLFKCCFPSRGPFLGPWVKEELRRMTEATGLRRVIDSSCQGPGQSVR